MAPVAPAARPISALAVQPDRAAQDRPAAVLDSRAIGWPEVAPLLAEAAGAQVLEEVLLSRVLDEEVRARGISVSAADMAAERTLLAETLADAAQVTADDAERLLAGVRISRGLGEKRFADLLKRNAQLRALVRMRSGPDAVAVTPEDIEQAMDIKHGPRIRARMILVRGEAQAKSAVDRLDAGEPFAEVAMALSADPSRLRGGLLDPISTSDPSYPVAFRRVLDQTPAGRHSRAVMVPWDNAPGYVVVRVEERLPGVEVDRVAVAPRVEREVRMVRERAAMDRMARDLIDSGAGRLSVLDASLEWSWRVRRAPAP
ncbi:MAG: hypothetical protein KF869_05175 [Phycisphaeraceae bacterium]|nr:hypothetical protein [Phycisphaeraceae bacterium]